MPPARTPPQRRGPIQFGAPPAAQIITGLTQHGVSICRDDPQVSGPTTTAESITWQVNTQPADNGLFGHHSELFSSSDFAGLKDVYRVGELPSPSPSAAIAGSLRRGCRWRGCCRGWCRSVRWRARARLLVWRPRYRLAHRPGDRRAAHSWSRMDISTSSYQRPSCSTDSRWRPSSTNPAFS